MVVPSIIRHFHLGLVAFVHRGIPQLIGVLDVEVGTAPVGVGHAGGDGEVRLRDPALAELYDGGEGVSIGDQGVLGLVLVLAVLVLDQVDAIIRDQVILDVVLGFLLPVREVHGVDILPGLCHITLVGGDRCHRAVPVVRGDDVQEVDLGIFVRCLLILPVKDIVLGVGFALVVVGFCCHAHDEQQEDGCPQCHQETVSHERSFSKQ